MTAQPNLRETSNDYSKVILRDGRFRVAECKDDIQWIVQRQRGCDGRAEPRWSTIAYCLNRNKLIELWRALTGQEGSRLERLIPEAFDKN